METLKKKALVATAWTFGSYASSQAIRLASNLILTRLLLPEYFGVMAIVLGFMMTLALLTDIGLGLNVIQSEKSDDQNFLNSIWTVSVIKGLLIFVLTLIAAYPMSLFYHEPSLAMLIPVVGFGSFVSSFNSTSIDVATKNLMQQKIALLELGSYLISVIVMIVWALLSPSVWALVVGGFVGSLVKMLVSHRLFGGERNKFHWDLSYVKYIFNFGSWIFLTTILGFVINSGPTLILGKFVSMGQLGIFSVTSTLGVFIQQIYQQVDNKVILPLLVKIRDLEIKELRKRLFKIKLAVIGAMLPPLWVMMVFGQQIIELMFDHRYHNGGWILRLFALGCTPTIIAAIGPFYMATGNSKLLMKMTFVNAVVFVSSVLIGYSMADYHGMIMAMALYGIPLHIFGTYVQIRHKVWIGEVEIIAGVLTALVWYAGISYTPLNMTAY